MGPKYEFTGETKVVDGHEVHRIRRISNGEIGGWIGSEEDLSQEGECWVGGEAVVWNSEVYEDAVVDGHAYVHWTEGDGIFGKAHIYGNANITGVIKINGNAKVYGNAIIENAWLSDKAEVYDNARLLGLAGVYGNAKVYGNAEIWYADIYDDVEVFGTAVIGYANTQEEFEKLSGNQIELHGNAKIGCGTISQNIDKDTPPSVYNNNIRTITSYQRDALYESLTEEEQKALDWFYEECYYVLSDKKDRDNFLNYVCMGTEQELVDLIYIINNMDSAILCDMFTNDGCGRLILDGGMPIYSLIRYVYKNVITKDTYLALYLCALLGIVEKERFDEFKFLDTLSTTESKKMDIISIAANKDDDYTLLFLKTIKNLYKIDDALGTAFLQKSTEHYALGERITIDGCEEFLKNPTIETAKVFISNLSHYDKLVNSDEILPYINNISIKNFLLDLIDSGLFIANNDVSLVTLLFVGEDMYEKKEQKTYDYNELVIKSKDNNINIILNKLYDGDDINGNDLYVTCTIKVNINEENIKSKCTIKNFNDFFNHIQWLHDTLMDMNYDEHYIRLLE